jgi:hypothetical protein
MGRDLNNHVIAAAILDRILYRCTTVNTKEDSYRLKESKAAGIETSKSLGMSRENAYAWRKFNFILP